MEGVTMLKQYDIDALAPSGQYVAPGDEQLALAILDHLETMRVARLDNARVRPNIGGWRSLLRPFTTVCRKCVPDPAGAVWSPLPLFAMAPQRVGNRKKPVLAPVACEFCGEEI
jgi:hypothetical protein